MKQNIGMLDRTIRLLLAIAIATLYFTKVFSPVAGIILLIAACIIFTTAFLGSCPLYSLLGISTCTYSKKNIKQHHTSGMIQD